MEFSHGIEEGETPAPIRDGISKEQGRAWGRKRKVLGLVGRRRETEGVCVMGKERKRSQKSALSIKRVGAH